MKRKARNDNGFRVNQCSVCDAFTLTAGQQIHGGVRYCQDCLKSTLGWLQMSQEMRDKVVAMFEQLVAQPVVQTALAAGKAITAEERTAHAIGESKRRLMDAYRHEIDE
jgi:hypothetical protein